jgi:hypothetical protein
MTDPNLLDNVGDLDDEGLIAAVRRASEAMDPIPVGLVERMVTVTRDVVREDPDLELELMLVMERFAELVGTRGGARSYTLRFGGEGIDLLVRVGVSEEEGRARLDGWVVPATSAPVQIREVGGEGRSYDGAAAETGRFEFPDLPTGFYRVSIQLADDQAFGTPAFEI